MCADGAQRHVVEVSEGRLTLRELAVALPAGAGAATAELVADTGRQPLAARRDGDRLVIDLGGARAIEVGGALTVAARW